MHTTTAIVRESALVLLGDIPSIAACMAPAPLRSPSSWIRTPNVVFADRRLAWVDTMPYPLPPGFELPPWDTTQFTIRCFADWQTARQIAADGPLPTGWPPLVAAGPRATDAAILQLLQTGAIAGYWTEPLLAGDLPRYARALFG